MPTRTAKWNIPDYSLNIKADKMAGKWFFNKMWA